MTTKAKPIHILLVDDDDNDVEVTRRALTQQKAFLEIDVARNGRECIEYLAGAANLPDLIILDINMPVMDGKETLNQLKADPRTRAIPVVMLTSSDADTDILAAYTNQAACYIVKPVEFEKFQEVVRKLDEFWFSIVRLPNHPEATVQ